MLKGKTEYLDYTVQPTREGVEILAEQALQRIENVDGTDYLDGIKLPPDNDERFDSRKITGHITYWALHEGEVVYREEIHEYESSFTNKNAREINIQCIVRGMKPLFIKWVDVLIDSPANPDTETKNTSSLQLTRPPRSLPATLGDILGSKEVKRIQEEKDKQKAENVRRLQASRRRKRPGPPTLFK